MTRWGTYYGKRYKQWIADAINELPPSNKPPLEVLLYLELVFAISRSRTGSLLTPVGDGDNYEKAIYDLLQKQGYIKDDRQITTATWRKRFVPYGTDGYTEIKLWEETEEIEL